MPFVISSKEMSYALYFIFPTSLSNFMTTHTNNLNSHTAEQQSIKKFKTFAGVKKKINQTKLKLNNKCKVSTFCEAPQIIPNSK